MKLFGLIEVIFSSLIIKNVAPLHLHREVSEYLTYPDIMKGTKSKASMHFPITPLPSHLSVFKKWGLTKYTNVFGVHIAALDLVPDAKVEHAANVMAQYLDNDENGTPDNPLVLKSILEKKSILVMFNNSHDKIVKDFQKVTFDADGLPISYYGFYCQDQELNETAPKGKFDESFEEILHLLTNNGWSVVYPHAFGISADTPRMSALTRNMVKMVGDCGYLFNHTLKWPNCTGHFHYHSLNQVCNFKCLQPEYIYWMLTSILGAQDGPLAPEGRCKEISDEWELCNKELVKKYNPDGYALFTDKEYQLPKKLPNGKYEPHANVIEI